MTSDICLYMYQNSQSSTDPQIKVLSTVLYQTEFCSSQWLHGKSHTLITACRIWQAEYNKVRHLYLTWVLIIIKSLFSKLTLQLIICQSWHFVLLTNRSSQTTKQVLRLTRQGWVSKRPQRAHGRCRHCWWTSWWEAISGLSFQSYLSKSRRCYKLCGTTNSPSGSQKHFCCTWPLISSYLLNCSACEDKSHAQEIIKSLTLILMPYIRVKPHSNHHVTIINLHHVSF